MFDSRPYLDRLEALCDVEHVKAAEARQLASGRWQAANRRPTIVTCYDSMRHIRYEWPPDWPQFPRSEFANDPGKMLVAELAEAYEGALLRDDRAYTVRADYGAVIIPSLFGCKYVEEGNEMPWLEHLPSLKAVEALIDAGMPELRAGLGRKVEETEQYFLEMIAPYEKLSQVVHVGCPDTQAPFNLAASIIGSQIYLAVYDNPGLVHTLLRLVTDTCLEFTKSHKRNVGEEMNKSYIMGWCTDGGIRIVDDSAVNLSEEMYREFCVPYNTQLSRAFDGFIGHFCGRGGQILEAMLSITGIRALNFGNPEMQDWNLVAAAASRSGACLLWDGDIPLEGDNITTGIVHKHFAFTWAEAVETAKSILEEQ